MVASITTLARKLLRTLLDKVGQPIQRSVLDL
jgi:hypothetical protein